MTSQLQIQKQTVSTSYDVQMWQVLRSKKDIEHYTHVLRTIYVMMEDGQVKDTAAKFLRQQFKVREIMNDLIERIKMNRKAKDYTTYLQLEQEIEIFDEIHFRLKKRYYHFVSKYFSPGSPQRGNAVA